MFAKSHRKWFAGFAILLSLVLLAVACGDSATSTPRPVAATSTPEPVAAKRFEGHKMSVALYGGVWLETVRDLMGKKFTETYGGEIAFVPITGDYIGLIATAPADKPPYDMVSAYQPDLLRGIAEELWLPLRLENIPNSQDLNPFHLRTSGLGYDGIDLKYGLPFEFGFLVLGYNKEVAPYELTSWADLWLPEFQGKIGLDTQFHIDTTQAAAFILDDQPGLDEMYTDEGMDAIIEKLLELDVALWWDSGAQATAAMERGDIAIIPHGVEHIVSLVRKNPDKFAMAIPKEGSLSWIDYLAVVRGTEERDMAEAFMDFMLDPVLQTEFAEFVPYFMSNSKITFGPIAAAFLPSTKAEQEASYVAIDWGIINDTWGHVDERLRKELYAK